MTECTLIPVSTGMGDRLWAGVLPRYVISQLGQLCSSWIAALIDWDGGGKVTSAGCQVTLCDPV